VVRPGPTLTLTLPPTLSPTPKQEGIEQELILPPPLPPTPTPTPNPKQEGIEQELVELKESEEVKAAQHARSGLDPTQSARRSQKPLGCSGPPSTRAQEERPWRRSGACPLACPLARPMAPMPLRL